MSDPNMPHDPIDQAYVRAEAQLDDEAARAARRARILAAVAEVAPATPAAPVVLRRRMPWRGAGFATAAGVAGLGVFLAFQVHRVQNPPPVSPPATTPAAEPQAVLQTPPPATPASASARPPGPVAPPPAAPLRAAPPPPPLPAPVAAAAPPPVQNANVAVAASPAAPADIGGQGSRATLVPTDGQRMPAAPAAPAPPIQAVPAPIAPPAPPAPPPPAASAGRGGSVSTVTSVGTNIAGVKAVGSPVQRLNREEVLKSGATSLRDVLGTLPSIQVGDPGAALRAAALSGEVQDIQTLLDQGTPVDAANPDGDTALMLAIRSNHPAAAALLHRRGASLDLANKAGKTARDMVKALDDLGMNRALDIPP